jgi:hypothetical protein
VAHPFAILQIFPADRRETLAAEKFDQARCGRAQDRSSSFAFGSNGLSAAEIYM